MIDAPGPLALLSAVAPIRGYRLSPQQEQRWGTRGAARGRVRLAARVDRHLQRGDVAGAVERVMARHPILRTRFEIAANAEPPMQVVEPSGTAGDGLEIEVLPDGPTSVRITLTADPLVADRETLRLVLSELLRDCADVPPDDAIASAPYLNISEWQHDLLRQQDATEMLDWWRQRIDDVSAAVAGSGVDGVESGAWMAVPAACRSALAETIRAVAADRQVEVSDVLLAAWMLSQAFFLRDLDVPIAVRLDGRFAPELETTVGPLSRYLPLRVRGSGVRTFSDLVARVHDTVGQAGDRQEYFHPAAAARVDPLLTGRVSAFAFVDAPPQGLLDGAVSIEDEDEPPPPSCPYSLEGAWDGERLVIRLRHGAALDPATAAAMADAFSACLEWGVRHVSEPLAGVCPVSPTARAGLLGAGRGPERDESEPTLIPDLITRAIHSAPASVAVASGERQLTYAALGAEAAALAARLVEAGVGPECPVGVLMPASPEAIVAMVAILQAGGVYVPLDRDDPPTRLERLLERLRVPVVVTTEASAGRLRWIPATVIAVTLGDPPRAGTPAVRLHPEATAYVIHTSGSTGESKAVATPHRTLLASTLARRQYYREPVSRFLLLSPLTFDSSIAGLFWTLIDGGTLVLPPEGLPDPSSLRALITEERVAALLCIPKVLLAISECSSSRDLAALRVAVVAGEPCPRSTAIAFAGVAPGCALYNEYGVTEAGVWSTVHRVESSDAETIVPVGEAIAGVGLQVCTGSQQMVPRGAVGELFIGGLPLARGYVGQPGATAARFVPDPHGLSGSRRYHTGDLVRWSRERTLHYVGRADNQLKIRGQRVEPEQLEAILREDLPISEAAVVPCGPETSRGLAVFYTTSPPQAVTPEQVRAVLAARLPAGVVPAHVIPCDRMPHTATGKLDRQQLTRSPLPTPTPATLDGPRTAVERTLADIWAPLLGVPSVGRNDDFFELGGDSIVALQVASRARNAALSVTPRQVLACRTIAVLAAEIQAAAAPATTQSADADQLTPSQQWFFAERFPDPHHYNQGLLLESRSRLDVGAFDEALRAVVATHEALRTGFELGDDGWHARVHDEIGVCRARVIDASSVDPRDLPGVMDRPIAEAQTSFNLARPPLLAATVLLAGDTARVALIAHHLVIDAVSWRIVLEDLLDAYQAARDGQPIRLPPVAAAPRHWMRALAARTSDPSIRAGASFWLDDPPDPGAARLPVDYPGGRNLESSAVTTTVSLDPDRTRRLWRIASDDGGDSILLGAIGRSVAEWCERESVWMAVERHGRDVAETESDLSRTVGWLSTAFPVHLRLSRSMPAVEAVASVREQIRRIPAEAWLYSYLRHTGALGDSALRSLPTPAVCFNNLGRVQRTISASLPLQLAENTLGHLRSPEAHRPYLIDVTVTTVEDSLRIAFTYSSALHASATIDRLGARVRDVLERICEVAATVKGVRHVQ